MKKILVSIVMPVYNPGDYLRPCLDSLLSQTIKDFQIIAIDDVSTDSSFGTLKEYQRNDSRVMAFRNPYHIGAARTRNIGIQLAEGKYLSVLDADDYFEPEYLERMLRPMESPEVDAVTCDFYMRDEATCKEYELPLHPFIKSKMKSDVIINQSSDYFFQMFSENPFTKMWRLSYIRKQGIQFQDIRHSNDVFFGRVGLLSANRIVHVDCPLVHYRLNTKHQISAVRGKRPLYIFAALRKVYQYLIDTGSYNKYKQSFNNWAMNHLVANISLAKEREKRIAIRYMREHGFKALSMDSLNRDDFLGLRMYYVWYDFYNNGILDTSISKYVYRDFFQLLKKHEDRSYALWGYGKLGGRFAKMAKEYKFPLAEIYDQDINKWDGSSVPPVKSFESRCNSVNAIIYTNARFKSEIEAVVNEVDADIELIDFSLYSEFKNGD